MNYSYCSDLEKCLQDTCSVLVSVHETISFYIDKPFYGRLLGDLERKQAQFLDILDRVQGEGEKALKLKEELETWSDGLLNLMLKDQEVSTKVKSINSLKNARKLQGSDLVF